MTPEKETITPREWRLEWKIGPAGFEQWWVDGAPSCEQHELVHVREVLPNTITLSKDVVVEVRWALDCALRQWKMHMTDLGQGDLEELDHEESNWYREHARVLAKLEAALKEAGE